MLSKKQQEILTSLEKWFAGKKKAAIAFSGGVDSSLLFFIGNRVLGSNCIGVFAKSPVVADYQLASAQEFAENYNLNLEIKAFLPFDLPGFADNSPERCYICKRALYTQLKNSLAPGWLLVDGTNLDDNVNDRPGFQAIRELDIATPYLNCSINKAQIRDLSKALDLSSWDKPSDSCLATRIPKGAIINEDDLKKVASAEADLRSLGFEGARAMPYGDKILLTFKQGDLERALMPEVRKNIEKKLLEGSFSKVFLDLSEREGILPSLLDYIGFTGDKAPQKRLADYFK